MTELWNRIPAARRDAVRARLQPGESLLACFEPDVDQQLRYTRQLVLLTNRRLLGDLHGEELAEIALGDDVTLKVHEEPATGLLEAVSSAQRLAHWRFTAARTSSARGLLQKWESARTGIETVSSICPSCGSPIPATEDQCPSCNPPTQRESLSALLRLVHFAQPRLPVILLAFALTLASTAAALVPPYLTIPLLDQILIPYQTETPGLPFHYIYYYLAGLFVAAVVTWMLDWANAHVSAWVSERISGDLRLRTYAHLQRLSVEFFGGKRTGDLMSRISSDTDCLCTFLSAQLVSFANDILMIIMTAIVLLLIDPWLALVTLIPFPIIVWLVQRVRAHLLKGYHQGSIAWADMVSVLADTIPGIRVVKAFAQETREIDRFRVSNDLVLRANDRLNTIWAYFTPLVTFLTTLGLLIVWVFAAHRVFHSFITVGVLTAFLAYITRFYARTESMIRFFSSVQRAAASAQRLFEILDRKPSVPDPEKPVDPGRLRGQIELKGVRFKYGTREVLHGLDLVIRPGEMIGLVGPSGAGKTTLINLICRFFDVAEGAILVDGVDIRSYAVEPYRQNIGIVLQDPFLFYGTISENVAYGKPDASHAQILAAARAARAHDFILHMPDAYDSIVGERGQSLSGGERQRISIARALLIDPRLLILDEATSSVDTQTEQMIQAALDTLIQGRTTIAIAHRLSTLRRADRIVVIDRGNIVEIGTHQELMAKDGLYANLQRAQHPEGADERQAVEEG